MGKRTSSAANGTFASHHRHHIQVERGLPDAKFHLQRRTLMFFDRLRRRRTHSPGQRRMWLPHGPGNSSIKLIRTIKIHFICNQNAPALKSSFQNLVDLAAKSSVHANVLDCTRLESPALLCIGSIHCKWRIQRKNCGVMGIVAIQNK